MCKRDILKTLKKMRLSVDAYVDGEKKTKDANCKMSDRQRWHVKLMHPLISYKTLETKPLVHYEAVFVFLAL